MSTPSTTSSLPTIILPISVFSVAIDTELLDLGAHRARVDVSAICQCHRVRLLGVRWLRALPVRGGAAARIAPPPSSRGRMSWK